MKHRTLTISASLIAFILIVGFVAIRLISPSEKSVRLIIESDLKSGASKEEILSFCRRRGFTCFDLAQQGINATINTNTLWPISGGIFVHFELTTKNTLSNYSVNEQYDFL